MTRPIPELRQGRDGPTQATKLLNELRRYTYRGPGISIVPADETLAAFSCVTFSQETGNVILAQNDTTTYASGVLVNAVNVGELAIVVSIGLVLGAVSGRAPNDALWVGAAGEIVFAAPGAGYVQPMGVCVSATDIFVSVSVPVI